MADIIPIGESRPSLPKGPDAHGQAALMLAESMLHTLVDARAITLQDALSIVQTAVDTKVEVGKDSNGQSATMAESLNILGRIATSFEADLN
ncbi:hypothetical protein [Sphingomonas abietis]|uniref:Uncharacterized protein n=1 Tax=Sphingomonas abietis TaxID=3012344 RepID=A0ABY7NSF0_9SPHN|nr:hypothetical protein [Sphingomonas abietis]WBO24430.1 hypothetical protein PBT88_10170 [Sphingomonas abietis]